MKVHFISIGGAVMHNMALAMQQAGHLVSGSDDEIKEPARSRLKSAGLLPDIEGWFPEKILPDLDMIILGMHARKDNPELIKAQQLSLNIHSFPGFLYEIGKTKNRIVIGGSHGKTTSTAMLMHIFKSAGLAFDYMVGSQIKGFDTMVGFHPLNSWMILEGDEYLTSALDLRPKFHIYQATHAMLTGIAWDHINVFPTIESYHSAFEFFIDQLPDGAPLVWFQNDTVLKALVKPHETRLNSLPYHTHPYRLIDGKTALIWSGGEMPVPFFGAHFLQNAAGVVLLAQSAGISDEHIYEALSTFPGTSRRMEIIYQKDTSLIIRDFAHSPSKVQATVKAIKNQFPHRKLTAIYELHTYSSLNPDFLSQYQHCLSDADYAAVYINPHTLEIKKMAPLPPELIKKGFGENVEVISDEDTLQIWINKFPCTDENLLLMSSGTFDGLTLNWS